MKRLTKVARRMFQEYLKEKKNKEPEKMTEYLCCENKFSVVLVSKVCTKVLRTFSLFIIFSLRLRYIMKILLHDVSRDIQNYQGFGKCYQPKPSAYVALDNSR